MSGQKWAWPPYSKVARVRLRLPCGFALGRSVKNRGPAQPPPLTPLTEGSSMGGKYFDIAEIRAMPESLRGAIGGGLGCRKRGGFIGRPREKCKVRLSKASCSRVPAVRK
jgi:hypothetical protein